MITISPRWPEQAVAVVFASDIHYFPYLSVAILSLIEHSSASHRYDVIVLTDAAAVAEEQQLKSLCADRDNISIRCIDMADFQRECAGFGVRSHLSVAAYYRLYIASICAEYQKILYMDCDVLCCADVAELFYKDLGTNLVAAAYDLPIQDIRSEWLDGARAYIESIGMKDAKQCFNSGVLVMNLQQMREENTEQELLRVAAINKKYWHDQSVLNICCQGRVLFLPECWNFTTHMYAPGRLSPHTAAECLTLIQQRSYNIIHYAAGCIKPWQTFTSPLYQEWWKVAARTPYYGVICQRTVKQAQQKCTCKKQVKMMISVLLALICPTGNNQCRARRHMLQLGAAAADWERWLQMWKTL